VGERTAPEVAGAIDQVITFANVKRLMAEASLVPSRLDETDFDGPRPYLGRVASVGGGLSRSLGSPYDVLIDHMSVTYGRGRSLGALHQIASGLIETRFMDLAYCDGCVDGPFGGDELSVVGRRGIVARYTETEMESQHPATVVRELDSYRDVFLGRRFLNMEQKLPEPTEQEIEAVLRRIDKEPPLRNIDCRACGYPSCRDKAIAVAEGMAEAEACLPYLLQQSEKIRQQLEKSHRELQAAHQALEHTQSQLIRTEKFASLGQLAAGVAHEINNPLGTITIYSHLVLKSLEPDDPRREDMELIVKEADRAKQIVQGLLSFAREAKLRPAPTDINELLEDVLGLVANQSAFHNIKIRKIFATRMPAITVDSAQLKQVFLNIILNAAEAMEGRGTITIVTVGGKRKISVTIKDTGPGISPEVMEKLFSPFFTTKEKGTGLGLAISYGITERHSGRIDVKTALGKGSTFIVSLPVTKEKEGFLDEGKAEDPENEISRNREKRNGEKSENTARGR
jgi:signal transduction histidine kinase